MESITYQEALDKSKNRVPDIDLDGMFRILLTGDNEYVLNKIKQHIEQLREAHVEALVTATEALVAMAFSANTLSCLTESMENGIEALKIIGGFDEQTS